MKNHTIQSTIHRALAYHRITVNLMMRGYGEAEAQPFEEELRLEHFVDGMLDPYLTDQLGYIPDIRLERRAFAIIAIAQFRNESDATLWSLLR